MGPRHPAAAAALLSSVLVVGGACSPSDAGSGGPASADARAPVASISERARSATTYEPRRYDTAVAERTFVDASTGRSLRTLIRYPAAGDGAPYPFVVLSHGLGGRPENYTRLSEAVAARGYVVAAPAFPLTSAGVQPPVLGDVVHQPGDVSFVIDEVAALSASPGSEVTGLVDDSRIGLVGHSLGAITTLLTGWNTCCHDPRVDAGVAMAGLALFGDPPPGWFEGIDTPLLFVHGDADVVVGHSGGRAAYAMAGAPKWFLTLVGGDHASPYLGVGGSPWYPVVEEAVVAFLDLYVAGDDAAVERLRSAGDEPGVARTESVLTAG